MKRKKGLPWLVMAVIGGMLLIPLNGYASVSDDIQKQLNQLEKQKADAERKKQEAEKLQSSLKAQMEQEKKSIDAIQNEIATQGKRLDDLNQQKVKAELELANTKTQLDEADARVKSRDTMLKSRVQLMYLNGSVSYLDVLFSATSFADFLDRFQSLTTIVGNDKDILVANQKDRDIVAVAKKQQETTLAEKAALLAEAELVKQTLLKREKQREVAIASLSKKEKEADSSEELQDEVLLSIIKQTQELRAKQAEAKRKESAAKGKVIPPQRAAYSGGRLEWPVPASSTITDVFGYRIDPIKNVRKLHKGIDIGAPKGTAIVAADDGDVLIASWVSGYGNTVVIDHGNGLLTWYGHMSRITVGEGDSVKRKDKIGEVGSTGDSTGNHLHFEVRQGDNASDPMPYLR